MQRNDLRNIFPVMIGEASHSVDDGEVLYHDFFKGGIPECKDEVVNSIEKKLWEHLERLDKGCPKKPRSERTVKKTLNEILKYQGMKFMGFQDDKMQLLVDVLVKLSTRQD